MKLNTCDRQSKDVPNAGGMRSIMNIAGVVLAHVTDECILIDASMPVKYYALPASPGEEVTYQLSGAT